MIDAYNFGAIQINGKEYSQDVIIFPDYVFSPWWRAEGHNLAVSDLQKVITYHPEVLIIGQGASGRMAVPAETEEYLEKLDITLFIEPTGNAVERYNSVSASANTVAALHLTC